MNDALFPGVVRIEPAGACNLACRHCPTGTVDLARGIMSEATFDRVLSQLREAVDRIRVVVLYHGGEPLLNKRLPHMIAALKAIGIPRIKTVSNGMMLDGQWAADLAASSLDEIEFSLDGQSLAENDLVRRRSSGTVVLAHVKDLLGRLGTMRSALKVSIASTQFVGLDDPLPPGPAPDPLWVRGALGSLAEQVNFKSTWALVWPHMQVDESLFVQRPAKQAAPLLLCDHVENTLTVRWDGTVVACCYDLTNKLIIGNGLTDRLDNIWHGKPRQAIRDSISSGGCPAACVRCAAIRPPTYLSWRAGAIGAG